MLSLPTLSAALWSALTFAQVTAGTSPLQTPQDPPSDPVQSPLEEPAEVVEDPQLEEVPPPSEEASSAAEDDFFAGAEVPDEEFFGEEGEPDLLMEEVVVEGRGTALTGIASSATEGVVGKEELERRPIQRPGELLETVPGIVITQHSGAGKGNQFFLRGFNLDHGTDLLVRFNGIPNNLPSHGHGQGYNDLNFLIPELVDSVSYRKGPYYAENGDFASAGSVDIDYVRSLDQGFALIEVGSYDYSRALVADSHQVGGGDLLYAAEIMHQDGPWDVEQDHEKFNAVVRYTMGDDNDGSSFLATAYDAEWTSTDHVAERAVEDGIIGRFGSLDPTAGGRSARYALNGQWWSRTEEEAWDMNAYAYFYDLDLYSNFTYFLNDPVNGDQFLQQDRRWVQGFTGQYRWSSDFGESFAENSIGVELRNDVIDNGLFNTNRRRILSTVREDEILQTSLGLYADTEIFWNDWFRSEFGLRGDIYRFDVDSDLEANSGDDTDALLSPKAGLVFGPWNDTEIYLQGGFGFHSNDARGVTITDDPLTPEEGDGNPVDALVRQKGIELGVRSTAVEGLQSTLSLWYLESDSELLFVGDAGTTEASGATDRYGIEWTNFWQINDSWTLDLDLAASEARFSDEPDESNNVPGAIDKVAALGATWRHPEKSHYWSIRGRYFGPRDLIEDASAQSSVSFLVNMHFGYEFEPGKILRLSFFNLFDREVNDIEYFYPSRLQGEPVGPDEGGFNDIHFHPAEPFTVRLALILSF